MSLIPNPFGRRSGVFDPFSLDLWDHQVHHPFRSLSDLSSRSETESFAHAHIDWKETPTAHVFKADVEVEDGRILQISGERKREQEKKTDTWHRVERSSGTFTRTFRLPENASLEEVRAGMENGVLTITVPKVNAKKEDVRSIEISG
ncbi:16.9 kDa class I heat shock protein 2-like [Pyrus ussuriensis x Pyrus communis]|uniref:16.9 kDa class I heat shock protein 2-like n=1 Tax=Pyrus ussuriensis x Pyrus communis TaxID=2448454 RepID=A0A5N5EZ94_9ROSA|nr:16.9 kDa class I heat shock protein 2-like [Pyrus ussuriensis x Pyrus communis]